MIFDIDWKDRELAFVAEEPLSLMHLTTADSGSRNVFQMLLPLIPKGTSSAEFEWQYSTLAPLMGGGNLDVLEFLAGNSQSVRYRIEELSKSSGDELKSFEIAFACPNDTLFDLLSNGKLSWGINLNICGWLGRKPQIPSFKFSGWKVRPLLPGVHLGFCTCNEAQGIELFAKSREDLLILTD